MEEFNAKLTHEAERLFRVKLPGLCQRFDDMLSEKDFDNSTLSKIREIIRNGCNTIVESKLLENKEKQRHLLLENCSDDEYHTPMNSDSESKPPAKKRAKKELLKRKAKSPNRNESGDEESEKDETVLESNPLITRMITLLKPELQEVTESCNTMKAWVQLQVPEMQDGNNFGVEVLGEVLGEVKATEDIANAFLQSLSLYYLTRAEIVSKFLKFSGVKDYMKGLEELDAKEFLSLRLIVREIRNSCMTLLDTYTKNIDKILKPRSHHNNMLVC